MESASAERVRSGGGRCLRARDLAGRRARGEDLADLDARRLEAHLEGCGRCRAFAGRLEPTVVGGNRPPSGANVPPVEAASSRGNGGTESGRSDVDAMGQDKKRSVVGQGYGPSKARQFIYYGVFLAVIVAIYFGGKIAVGELDKAPKKDPAQAPWSQDAAPQTAPQKFQ